MRLISKMLFRTKTPVLYIAIAIHSYISCLTPIHDKLAKIKNCKLEIVGKQKNKKAFTYHQEKTKYGVGPQKIKICNFGLIV